MTTAACLSVVLRRRQAVDIMAFRRQGESYRKVSSCFTNKILTQTSRPLYPASNRLQSIPPRYYDVVDGDTNQVIESDLHHRASRARSLARTSELREGWTQPRYSDLVLGSRAHPGHRAARSSTEFCRDIMSACRSPSPAPQHINDYHKDMICSNEEKIHQSRMKTM